MSLKEDTRLRGEILDLFCLAGETDRPTAFIHAWENESNLCRIQGEQQLPFTGTLLLGKNRKICSSPWSNMYPNNV
jgi:hypothetical protein